MTAIARKFDVKTPPFFAVQLSEFYVGRSNAQHMACIGRPEERHGVHCPVIGGTQGQRYGCRCDPHPASREIERGYTEFPVRGDIPPQKCGADGKSRRQRASHAIAPTGHGTLTKAPCVRLGRQDSWVRVTTSAEKVGL